MATLDKSHPTPEWIADLRRRFPCEDVSLGWLTGVGYTMLEDMWAMLNELT